MARKYNSNWNAKKMSVNFNEKQWRQDLAYFIVNKLYWYKVRVSRSRAVSRKTIDKGNKQFEIFDGYGGQVIVIYKNKCDLISSTHEELIKEYLHQKGVL